MAAVVVAGRHPVYELTAADLVIRQLDELSFVNLKQLFRNEELAALDVRPISYTVPAHAVSHRCDHVRMLHWLCCKVIIQCGHWYACHVGIDATRHWHASGVRAGCSP